MISEYWVYRRRTLVIVQKWRRLVHCVESDGDDSGDEEGIEPSDGSPGVTPGLYPMGGYGP